MPLYFVTLHGSRWQKACVGWTDKQTCIEKGNRINEMHNPKRRRRCDASGVFYRGFETI